MAKARVNLDMEVLDKLIAPKVKATAEQMAARASLMHPAKDNGGDSAGKDYGWKVEENTQGGKGYTPKTMGIVFTASAHAMNSNAQYNTLLKAAGEFSG